MLGAIFSAKKAVELNLWNRMVPNDRLDAEVDALIELILSKNQQTLRQLKFIINKGHETDLYTAQGFEILSASLSRAINGMWEVEDADRGAGLRAFNDKKDLWKTRRQLAKNWWAD